MPAPQTLQILYWPDSTEIVPILIETYLNDVELGPVEPYERYREGDDQ